MASREDVRQALIQRVSRKVSGHGVARRSVEGAVDRVLAALPEGALSSAGAPATRVVIFSATSAPDLASRARLILERGGATISDMGSATAGRHNVVTLRVSGVSPSDIERAAAELGAAVTMLDDASVQQVMA
jgi:hypothetical protein